MISSCESKNKLSCASEEHGQSQRLRLPVSSASVERTARLFRALGDAARIRLVAHLAHSPACVTELAALEGESITVISQRLRVLRADNIVNRRREGKHLIYFLADQHVLDLIFNGMAHASEHTDRIVTQQLPRYLPTLKGKSNMANEHVTHANHTHEHGKDCGHTAIKHDDHVDYLHDGHLHHKHEGHIDEHRLEVNAQNPADCTNGHKCDGHEAAHKHGPECGHEAVPHGDHVDYLVKGHLHHPDGDHCDNHGNVQVVS